MPEGHLIHRYAEEHAALFGGRRLNVSSPQGRFSVEAAQLDGRALRGVDAKGKHLIYAFGGDLLLHVHLGQAGRFIVGPDSSRAMIKNARLHLADGRHALDLVAPIVCCIISRRERDALFERLGPDPLRSDAQGAVVEERWRHSSMPIGSALMNQQIISGVGNVLRAEVLFLCGIHPARPAKQLTAAERECLWSTLLTTMRRAQEEGRIVTDRRANPEGVGPEPARYVYRQIHCRRCGTLISRWTMQGREIYACKRCQPEPGSDRPRPAPHRPANLAVG